MESRPLLTLPELVEGPADLSTGARRALSVLTPQGQDLAVPWTYILRCADGSYYVGSARDLAQRLDQHAAGTAGSYTSERRPVTVVWALESERIDEAAALERKIKGWRRAKRLALIEGRFADLPGLSRAGSHRPSVPPG